ncbi:MAG: FHA domain-containing protein [Planctomycetota bacterium]|jgi:pSer/pThr/pTyr-binding forkhead associated (FHA) protein
MASLLVFSGPHKGDFYPLDKGRATVIGRGEDCHIQIVDEQISRSHLKILFDGSDNSYQAVDMSSANGSFIDNRKITGPVRLTGDTIIRIGDSEVMFTRMNFDSRASALQYYERERKRGELEKDTLIE